MQVVGQRLGRVPLADDFNKKKGLPSYMTYMNYFGSWNNALKEAGFKPTVRKDYTKEELIKILQEFAQELGRTPMQRDLIKYPNLPSIRTFYYHFETWNNALREAGISVIEKKKYNKENLIEILQQLAQELGRTPIIADLKKRSDLPSEKTYQIRFGSWSNALREAGLIE